MLPASARLRRRREFTEVVRRGRRAGRARIVAYLLVDSTAGHPPLAGFVVGRAVGGAVARNRVRRRLRHLLRPRLATVPPGSSLVVRALPAAATASFAELADDLDAALRRLGVHVRPGGAPVVQRAEPVSASGGARSATLLP